MYKILKSMLAEFSYFIEKHFGITSILWSILFMAGCCAIVGVVIMKTAEIISCCKSTKKAKKSGSKSGGKNGITDSDEAANVVSADNTGNNECGKCKNGLSMFPVYVGFTVVCSYMMNRLIALSYTWDSKLQRVMSNFHYVLSFKANRKLFLNALSLPDNTTNNNGLFQIAMYLNNNQWQKVYDNAGGSQWYFAKIKKAVDEILKVGDTHLTLGVVYQGAAMLIPIALIIVLGVILLLKGKKLHGILVLVCAGLCAFGNFGAVIFMATMLILGELLSIIVDSSLAKNKDLFDKRKQDLA